MLLAIGLGALGVMAWRRACRRYHGAGHGGCGHGRHGGRRRGWGRHGGGRRWMIDLALERLDASPAQERAIIAELDQLEERLHGVGRQLRELHGPLAEAVRASELDEATLAGLERAAEQATTEGRTAVLETLRKVHALLDDKQREQLGALLGRAGRRGPGGGGPYRV